MTAMPGLSNAKMAVAFVAIAHVYIILKAFKSIIWNCSQRKASTATTVQNWYRSQATPPPNHKRKSQAYLIKRISSLKAKKADLNLPNQKTSPSPFHKRCVWCGGVMEPTKYYIDESTATHMWYATHNEYWPRFRLWCCRTCGIAFHVRELA